MTPEQRARRAAEKVREWTAERDEAIREWRALEKAEATYRRIAEATKLSHGGIDRVLKRGQRP